MKNALYIYGITRLFCFTSRGHAAIRFAVLSLLSLWVLGTYAWADNVRAIWDCEATLACDASGACQPDARKVTFVLHNKAGPSNEFGLSYGPVKKANGVYLLSVKTTVREAGDLGPYLWRHRLDGVDRYNTILVADKDRLVWQVRAVKDGNLSTVVTFLKCKIDLK